MLLIIVLLYTLKTIYGISRGMYRFVHKHHITCECYSTMMILSGALNTLVHLIPNCRRFRQKNNVINLSI